MASMSNNNSQLSCNFLKLNAHNHPDKNGRSIYINGAHERKVKVYENNHKPEDPELMDLQINLEHLFDRGAFGCVCTARILPRNTVVAVKQVLQDNRYRNRELPLMKKLSHRNIVILLYYYYHTEDKRNIYLNLVMEYMPSNLNILIQRNKKIKKTSRNYSLPHGDLCSPSAGPVTPLLTIKLCMYQIFRALAYIHSQGICHRDIKPNNLLFDPDTGVLKICDFGSAKHLRKGESHVSYICARFYRAPELLFGATDYNEKIDLWSTGVVFSELFLGDAIFAETSGLDQLVLIISKLGTPTKEQLEAMNPRYAKYELPQVYRQPPESLFPCAPPDARELIMQLFQYDPSHRIPPIEACAHPFFDELRIHNKKWFGHDLPPLFDFTKHELSMMDMNTKRKLMPYPPDRVNNIVYLHQQQPNQQQISQQPPQPAPRVMVQHQPQPPTQPPRNISTTLATAISSSNNNINNQGTSSSPPPYLQQIISNPSVNSSNTQQPPPSLNLETTSSIIGSQQSGPITTTDPTIATNNNNTNISKLKEEIEEH